MTFHARSSWLALLFIATTNVAIADDPPSIPGKTRVPTPAASRAPAEDAELAPPLSPTPAPDAQLKPKLQPQSVVVTLINGNTMMGTISDADQWTMKTSFGTANVPLSAVAGIRMAQEGSATTTVALHNGDTITGAVEIDRVAIQTDWGRAEILGTHVASILFTTGLKWTSEPGLNGTRWKLVAVEPRTATTKSVGPNAIAQPRGPTVNRPVGRP